MIKINSLRSHPATAQRTFNAPGRWTGADLDNCKQKFKEAWARIRAILTDQDIADAQQIAALSAEVLARYNRRHGR
jgi:hypothetical protein